MDPAVAPDEFVINQGAAWDSVLLLPNGAAELAFEDWVAWHFACFIPKQATSLDESGETAQCHTI